VIGIKTVAQSERPAYYVPRYLAEVGFDLIPVPVYYPDARTILGRPIYRRLVDIPGPPVDIANVFRRPRDLMGHLPDLLLARPRVVWLPLRVRHDRFAARLTEAGILVIQDLCLMVEVIKRGIRPQHEQASAQPV
jgi:predicted CoA-binding protein